MMVHKGFRFFRWGFLNQEALVQGVFTRRILQFEALDEYIKGPLFLKPPSGLH